MWISKRLVLRAVCGGLASAVLVFACGPFFGIEALQNRAGTELAAPAVSFQEELKALVPELDQKLPVVEADDKDAERSNVELQELTAPGSDRVQAVRKAGDEQAALALAAQLPPALREYMQGATCFHYNDWAAAKSHFEAVLQLPESERRSREVWARYMLARVAVKSGSPSEAVAAFAAVRPAVQAGVPDLLGLGVASLGEQARVLWQQGSIIPAIHLYAQQARYGSEIAINSLLYVAHQILNNAGFLQQAIRDPLTRKLLFIVLNNDNSHLLFEDENRPPGAPAIERIVSLLEENHITEVDGAGLLASAAYRAGLFDLAQRFTERDSGPIASWVAAQLELRHGDQKGALDRFSKALQGLERSRNGAAGVQLRAKLGILRVSRGEYLQALDLFRSAFERVWNDAKTDHDWDPKGESYGFADYWGDIAYLAERVLTLDELQRYLNDQVSRSDIRDGTNLQGAAVCQKRLRQLLARRLIRTGRFREAARFLDDDEALRAAALAYGSNLNEADSWWRFKTTRAEAAFRAATLAKQRGIELLGFEGRPDYAMWHGSYYPLNDVEQEARNAAQNAPYEGSNERQRLTESRPWTDTRFQYRLVAVNDAMKAADLLPSRSQAFAAVLCQATSWIIDHDPERAQSVYRRYLQQGAHVAWGKSFGRSCPQPNFAALSFAEASQRSGHKAWRHASAHPFLAGGLGLLGVVGVAVLFLFAMRRSRSRSLI